MDSRKLIPFLVGGLPAALAVSVVIGLIVYYSIDHEPPDAGDPAAGGIAIRTSTPPDQAALANWFHALHDVLGPRPADDPAAVAKTGRYLESTLGRRNFGFETRRPLAGAGAEGDAAAPPDEAGWSWIEADVPGARQPDHVVLVTARFDTGFRPGDAPGGGAPAAATGETELADSSARTAVLLAVARAMAGDELDRTVRFAFAGGPASTGDQIAEHTASRGQRVVAHLALGGALGTGSGDVTATLQPGSTRLDGDFPPTGPGVTPGALTAAAIRIVGTVREAAKNQR
jgi:hypothetical protein